MKKTPFPQSQAGTTLVELIVAAAILAIIGTFAANFFSRLNSADAEASARAAAVSQLTSYANTIDRDLKFRDLAGGAPPKLCNAGLCLNFSYTRLVGVAAPGTGEIPMQVRVQSSCVDVPAQINNFVKMDFTEAGIQALAGAQGGRCLRTLNCPKGKYPQTSFVLTTAANAKRPIYPPVLPLLRINQGVLKGVVGAAACAESSATTDRVVVEAAVMTSEKVMRIEKKEIVFPRSNVANIQILPN